MLLMGVTMSHGVSMEAVQDVGDARSGKPVALTIRFFGKSEQGGPAPYELANDRMVVKARVAGRAVWALLDNQAERSLIDARFASDAGFRIDPPSGTVKTSFGEIPKRRVSDVPILIPGQFEMRAPAIAAADLKLLSQAVGREISYVIGGDMFGLFALLIDPGKGTFQIERGGSAKVSDALLPIPLREGSGRFEATINGKPVTLAIDLGSRAALRLSAEAWTRIAPQIAGAHPTMTGTARATGVTIGPVTGTDVDVEIGPLLGEQADGVVGMGFLKRYLVVLDLQQNKLWLAPRRAAAQSAEM